MGSLTRTRQFSIGAAVVAVLILVAGWFLLVQPKRSDATDLRAQVDQQRTANTQLSQKIQMLRAQAKDLPAVQAKLSAFEAKIPDNPSLPALIRVLSATADDAGVDLVSIAPSEPGALTPSTGSAPSPAPSPSPSSDPADGSASSGSSSAAGGSSEAADAPTADGGTLAQIPVTVQVTGSYATVEQFFAGVEDMKRAMLVTGFTMAPGGSGDSGSGSGSGDGAPSGQLTANLTARVFLTQAASSVSGEAAQ